MTRLSTVPAFRSASDKRGKHQQAHHKQITLNDSVTSTTIRGKIFLQNLETSL